MATPLKKASEPPAVNHLPDSQDLVAVAQMAASFIDRRRQDAVVAGGDASELMRRLEGYDFASPASLKDVAQDVFDLLARHAVRSDHPNYFGLFNPPARTSATAGDLIAATVNPQLAVWSHAPAAAEIERKLVQFMGRYIWPSEQIAGTFTSGGTEANHTAVISALARRYPSWATQGLRSIDARPAIFASSESHLAWIKIARSVGLGSESIRLVTPQDGLSMTAEDLRKAIAQNADLDPVMIIGTAGTTGHGAVDDLRGLASVAAQHGSHFHVDAAWAGGGLLHADVQAALAGIDTADSVTLDPHKWLAVPMACGMFLTREWQHLERAFAVSTTYMPSASLEHRDAYIHSLQWSRRFIGLKLFMALATEGVPGYQAMIQRQLDLGAHLKRLLTASGWHIRNDTRLPLVCFRPSLDQADGDDHVLRIERAIAASGKAWISNVQLRKERVLRACLTSFETTQQDVETLVQLLDAVRASTAR